MIRMVSRRAQVMMLVGLCLLVLSFFAYLAMSMPGNLFFPIAIASFELMILGRMLASSRRELALLLIINIAFVAAGIPLLMNPSFNFEAWGIRPMWDDFAFMTLMTLAFITAGFLPIRKVEMMDYGVATAFVVSFFYEMFGVSLTLMILDVVFEKQFPLSGYLGLKSAHLWVTLGLMNYSSAHLFSGLVIVAGAVLVMLGHLTLYADKGQIVTRGVYRYVKHPQYVGVIVITGGMLIEYPTFLGLAMWAILILMYMRRARQESKEISRIRCRRDSANFSVDEDPVS
jgi:protein-S-isoprenylcysteine O-methyltransferase Ste14